MKAMTVCTHLHLDIYMHMYMRMYMYLYMHMNVYLYLSMGNTSHKYLHMQVPGGKRQAPKPFGGAKCQA